MLRIFRYEDDNLMTSALRTIGRVFGSRQSLLTALDRVIILENAVVPIFGKVQKLRTELSDLTYLAATTSVERCIMPDLTVRLFSLKTGPVCQVWGLKNLISGPFGNQEFGELMQRVDKLLQFLYSSPKQKDSEKTRKKVSNKRA